MTHQEAHILIAEWSAAELQQVRTIWYPAIAPGFADHQAGYRELHAPTARDARIESTGWIMWVLAVNKPIHHATLRRHYLDSRPVGIRARRAALDAFARAHAAWLSVMEDPPDQRD